MRLLPIALVLGFASTAQADTGFYVSENFSWASYKGDLDAYGAGGLRFTFGFNIRQDVWTTEILGGCILTDANAMTASTRQGGYCLAGVDLQRRWPIVQWRRFGVRLALHGGPRYFIGNEALYGFDGPGLAAGARLEGDVWVIGYFFGIGAEAMWMRMPADGVAGVTPLIGGGAKLGWL